MTEFNSFGKMARLSREVIVTEKIDGTNGQIFIGDDGEFLVGSRTRWIDPNCDNHGFARWAWDHMDELMIGLGSGRHFGEWWGSGINRGYGLPKGEKHFSIFNTIRWCLNSEEPQQIKTGDPRIVKMQDKLPPCCSLVPVLWRGLFDIIAIDSVLSDLATHGSKASIGYTNPEGVVIFHAAGNIAFKKTLGDDGHKGG
jgi:hypothetical protein